MTLSSLERHATHLHSVLQGNLPLSECQQALALACWEWIHDPSWEELLAAQIEALYPLHATATLDEYIQSLTPSQQLTAPPAFNQVPLLSICQSIQQFCKALRNDPVLVEQSLLYLERKVDATD